MACPRSQSLPSVNFHSNLFPIYRTLSGQGIPPRGDTAYILAVKILAELGRGWYTTVLPGQKGCEADLENLGTWHAQSKPSNGQEPSPTGFTTGRQELGALSRNRTRAAGSMRCFSFPRFCACITAVLLCARKMPCRSSLSISLAHPVRCQKWMETNKQTCVCITEFTLIPPGHPTETDLIISSGPTLGWPEKGKEEVRPRRLAEPQHLRSSCSSPCGTGWRRVLRPQASCDWLRGQALGLPGDSSLLQCLTHRDG